MREEQGVVLSQRGESSAGKLRACRDRCAMLKLQHKPKGTVQSRSDTQFVAGMLDLVARDASSTSAHVALEVSGF